MYCAYCGKHNADEMLFCGYCGKPLATPDHNEKPQQDVSRARYGRPDSEQKPSDGLRRASTIVPSRNQDDLFNKQQHESDRQSGELRRPAKQVKLRRVGAAPARGPANAQAGTATPAKRSVSASQDRLSLQSNAEQTPKSASRIAGNEVAGHPPVLNRSQPIASSPRTANTIVPRREPAWDEEDLFMESDYDDFDDYAETPRRRTDSRRDEYAYEEEEHTSFFVRHIRGIVTLILFLLTVAIIGMWAISDSGQTVLAKMDLSRRPSAYVRVARDSNRVGSYEMEGYYYMRALSLDKDNSNYAIGAANAYIAANNTSKATEALKLVIELQPESVDAYVLLSSLYPVVNTRPDDVRQLIDQGYQQTGDSRLKQ